MQYQAFHAHGGPVANVKFAVNLKTLISVGATDGLVIQVIIILINKIIIIIIID